MRRREILAFIAAFAVVLLGGAALAQVGTFSSSPAPAAAGALSAESAANVSSTTAAEAAASAAGDAVEPETETTVAGTVDEGASATEQGTEPTEPPKDDPEPTEPPKDEEDTTPPPLEILFPENNQRFEDEVLAFEGTTEPGARVFGGAYEADVDADGNWRIVLILSPGGNLVTFTAKDAAGNVTTESVKVYLDVPEVDKEFSAHQKWEVVDGSPAKNKYYGTGTPGTTVWVGSEYGDGSGKINEKGEWAFYVEFPSAPCNKSFQVVVENESNRREFTMKYVCTTEHEFTAHQEYAENTSLWTKFYGTGNPGDTIWAASEYGTETTTVNEAGEWYVKLHLSDGVPANEKIPVVIESSSGDRVEFWFKWIAEDKVIEFTANQKYGSCGSEIPWDKFWGTAQPGATIEVVSPYGSGTTTADGSGNWLIEVEFPEAPVDDPFTVVIESSDGGRATFSFTRL